MSTMSFLAKRPKASNDTIMNVTREAVVNGSVQIGLIKDNNLSMIPEMVESMAALSHTLRKDLIEYHNQIKKNLQFPIIRNQFTYAFAKGAESAYLWNESLDGKIEFNYNTQDSLQGNAGAQVNQEIANQITLAMLLVGDVFVDLQETLISPKYKFYENGHLLADTIAAGYFWATQVGLDFGLNKLGMP